MVAIAVMLVAFFARFFLARWLAARATRDDRRWLTDVARVVSATRGWLLLPLALYAGSLWLSISAKTHHVLAVAAALVVLLQMALWGQCVITCWMAHQRETHGTGASGRATIAELAAFIGRVALWSAVALLALGALGFDVSALVAGLGIGGIAVALAAQNILGDLFASASIMLDEPFVVGDFIIVGDFLGSVEHIGLKTTRLRSLSGEQLVFANTDLTKSRIRNYKKMAQRRNVFTVLVRYGTPRDKLERIPQGLREIVEARENVRFDRAHFKEFGESALVYEVVYYTLDPDYGFYMDTQQAINFAICEWFLRESIEFAHPVRVLQVPEPWRDERRESGGREIAAWNSRARASS